MSSVLVLLNVTLVAVLTLVAVHRLYLAARVWRLGPTPPEPAPERWPCVTVQLPLYNERYVAGRLIDAVCAMRYPGELQIQVLDDSTDSTREEVARIVASRAAEGFDIAHIRREGRVGFKAGALAHGMRSARGELIAIFDADFVPPPDFLERTVPWLLRPGVGMVQTRWTHLNREFNLLCRVQALMLDGHFVVEHAARHRAGRFFNFNGTAGIWRAEAISDAGGWQHDTLTEDLDLSYRAQLKGWRFVYLPEVETPAELPADVAAFKAQQFRWAKGSTQVALKLLGRIWSAPLPLGTRVEATFHLLGHVSYPLMLSLAVVMPLVAWSPPEWLPPWMLAADGVVMGLATLSLLVFYGVSQALSRAPWWRRLLLVPALMAVGAGLAVSNSLAVVEALVGRGSEFVRTPKYALVGAGQSLVGKGYRARAGWTPVAELVMGVHVAMGLAPAMRDGMVGRLPFMALFALGLLCVGGGSLLQPWLRRG